MKVVMCTKGLIHYETAEVVVLLKENESKVVDDVLAVALQKTFKDQVRIIEEVTETEVDSELALTTPKRKK